MIVGIVARGPLKDRLPKHRHTLDILIGVNHAAAEFACNWWCFGDAETYFQHHVRPMGFPSWFTNQNTARRLAKRDVSLPPTSRIWEDIAPNDLPPDIRHSWHVFSATAALMLAWHLQADRVVCFGVIDAEPQAGESPRWATERRIWNNVTRWLETRGVNVERA